jgi:2-hydroxychromene-2-carboxylate isomerase
MMRDSARRTIATAARKMLALALASGNAEEIQAAAIVTERALSTCEQNYAEPEVAEAVAPEAKKDFLM